MSDYIEERVRQYCYQVAHRLIKRGKYTLEEISEITEIPLEDVIEISQHPEYFTD